MKKLLPLLMLFALFVPSVSLAGLEPPGVLDEENVITNDRFAKYKVVGVRLFSIENVEYDNVDGRELRQLLKQLPDYQHLLARSIRSGLREFGFDAMIIQDENDAARADVILDGSITSVDLGNAVTRVIFFVTGNVGLSVDGRFVDAKTGDEIATFSHESSSGLDESFDKWQMLVREVAEMGNDISDFAGMLR